MVLTLLAAVFVFGLLVIVHELGHFITAKLTGMRVDEFAIGFGPKIVGFRRGETDYTIRAIPLGGFNDIAGMNPADNDAGERGYCQRPILARMVVILAGAVMNFILPIVLFFGIFTFAGVNTPNPEPVLGQVIEDKPAYNAGLRDGDKILTIDGETINSWQELVGAIENKNRPLAITAMRGDELITAEVEPTFDAKSNRSVIGVISAVTTTYPSVLECLKLAVVSTGKIIYMMLDALYKIILELSGSELAGPIGVAQMAGEVAQRGIVPLLNFTAFLSLNLGIVNLLPVPALDGGHFVGLVVEAVRGKPMSPKALEYTQRIGIVLLLLLMVLATKNDIVRVFTGG